MDIDEDYIQVKTLSDTIANAVIDAYKLRFQRMDHFEKSVVFSSLIKTLSSFLITLPPYERHEAIRASLILFDKILDEDQNW